jgi:hypothetical protein
MTGMPINGFVVFLFLTFRRILGRFGYYCYSTEDWRAVSSFFENSSDASEQSLSALLAGSSDNRGDGA